MLEEKSLIMDIRIPIDWFNSRLGTVKKLVYRKIGQ